MLWNCSVFFLFFIISFYRILWRPIQ